MDGHAHFYQYFAGPTYEGVMPRPSRTRVQIESATPQATASKCPGDPCVFVRDGMLSAPLAQGLRVKNEILASLRL